MDVPQGARLLSIGEIFDRAISVSLKNFWTLTLTCGAVLLPYMLLFSWVERAFAGKIYGAVESVIAHPDRSPNFNPGAPSYRLDANGWWLIALGLVIFPLAGAAIAACTADTVNGDRPSFSCSFRRAFRSWPRSVWVSFLSMIGVASGIFVVGAIYFVTVVVWIVATNQSTFSDSAAMAFVVVIGIMTSLFTIGAVPWTTYAFGAATLDGVGAFRALLNAWRACFRRPTIVRSLLFGFGMWAIIIIGLLFIYIIALIGIAVYQNYAASAVRLIVLTELAVFANVAGALFYLDAKTRYTAIQDAAQKRENSAAR